MKITWDSKAKAVYIYLASESESSVKTQEVQGGINIDYNAEGKVIGIEVLYLEEKPYLEDIG